MAVKAVLENLHIPYIGIELGRVEMAEALTPGQHTAFNTLLKEYQLEILDQRKAIMVERVKTLIIEMINSDNIESPLKFTVYISNFIGFDYTYLSNIFSEEEGSTIERFYITTRIERVKQLIVYEGLSLKEIAYRLNYSSVSHLSLQFKKVTGETPSTFKKNYHRPPHIWKKV